MNKELIKKYKAEFDHWLDGGNILVKMSTGWSPVIADYTWHLNDRPYVINDEYVEFRKAGAEGKQLQVSYNGGKTWFDKSYRKISWSKSQLVRIKPEEPKFKVGDWLIEIHSDSYAKVLEVIKKDLLRVYLYDSNAIITTESTDFILWQPKLGEWCVMYDTEENPNADSITLQKWDGKGKWIPIPFIGQLPPYIKDSDES